MPDATQSWSTRFFREGDEQPLIALLREAFQGWPQVEITVDPLEHLRWKLRPGALHRIFHVVAEDDRQMVGSRLYFVQRTRLNGHRSLSCQTVDLAVHPDHRNRGIYAGMREHGREEFRQTFDMRFGVSRHSAVAKLDEREAATPLTDRIEVLSHTLQSWTSAQLACDISETPSFDDRIDEFWEAAWRPYRFIVERSSDYLNWRYCDVRSGAFTVRLAEDDGRVLGYAVLRVSHGKGYIADLLVLPGRLDVATSLALNSLEHFGRQNVSKVECWLPVRHEYGGVLHDLGFRRADRPVPLASVGVSADCPPLDFLRDPEVRIHFTVGDTDLV